ncbi:hypothetical protein GCK72_016393 [Caenorhabditis remanei]|uniref:Uncharacterized protein n=1 Tax=Caenorhabditis remanei TaxID=31234 RepID=A0A6A5G4A9_CAERE|nr:hypothetical protein GCK72_016393 [Caenorhabditis remanei]KAF1749848.1 hypothetical protein GCK72_016393 [Caenorhabditis remanei]
MREKEQTDEAVMEMENGIKWGRKKRKCRSSNLGKKGITFVDQVFSNSENNLKLFRSGKQKKHVDSEETAPDSKDSVLHKRIIIKYADAEPSASASNAQQDHQDLPQLQNEKSPSAAPGALGQFGGAALPEPLGPAGQPGFNRNSGAPEAPGQVVDVLGTPGPAKSPGFYKFAEVQTRHVPAIQRLFRVPISKFLSP